MYLGKSGGKKNRTVTVLKELKNQLENSRPGVSK